jgi:hypothetical protein
MKEFSSWEYCSLKAALWECCSLKAVLRETVSQWKFWAKENVLEHKNDVPYAPKRRHLARW